MVNNPFYPFVFGNPNEYGSNTNPDPFFWGSDRQTKYCGCGASLKATQLAEGMCNDCSQTNGSGSGGKYRELDEQTHKNPTGANKPNSIIDNEAAQLVAQNQHTNNTQLKHAVAQHNNIKKLPKDTDTDSNGLDEIAVTVRGNTKYARNKNLLATLLGGEAGTFCASNPSACAQLENFSNSFTEQYDPKYQIYGNQQVNDDNYVPEASNYAGGVGWGGKNGNNKIGCVGCGGGSAVENMAQYPQQPPVNEIVNNNNQGGQLKKGFCAATMGGKKLAF